MGAVFRAVRLRHGWRQADVASRAGVSTATVSRIEHGHLERLKVGTLLTVAASLGIRVDWNARWRGGELDRMLASGHAAMHEHVARLLHDHGWLLSPETTFAIYGERGAIDILAFHPPSGALLVIELKTELVDVQELIGAVDRYRRLAPRIAAERGWAVASVSCWVALRDTPANHRRLAAHATVLRAAFPDDGRQVGSWLRRPAGTIAALSFLSDLPGRKAISGSAGVQRVRAPRPSVGPNGDPPELSPGANPRGFRPANHG